VFGLYLTGLFKLPFLERTHTIAVRRNFGSRYLTSFAFGAAFAAGWTPCVGAVLGGILGLAATEPGSAFSLLISYSLGLGIPFLLVGAFASSATPVLNRYQKTFGYARVVLGIILVILGVLVLTQTLSRYANIEFLSTLFN
jgi:cytochrome c-type biogenesis protein